MAAVRSVARWVAGAFAAGRRLYPLVAVAWAGTALSGCAVLTSQTASELIEGASPATGVRYALPRSVIDVALYVDSPKATFYVVRDEPYAIADPQHRYYLQHRPHASYDDDIAVTVSERGLLKTVSSTSTDRTREIILNLVKGAGGLPGLLESAQLPTGATLLQQVTIDPTDQKDREGAEALFNTAVREFAKGELARCGDQTYLKPSDEARCDELAQLKATARHIGIKVYPVTAPARSGPRQKPDCKVGICYRPALPFVFEQRIGKSVTKSIVLLPNLSSPVEIDIERAFLVKKYQVIEFDDQGQLKKLTVSKDSELYALSTLPVEVVQAVAESLRLRVKVLDTRINYANSTGELIKARADLEKQRVRFESALASVPARTTVGGVSIVPRQSETPAVPAGNQSFLDRESAANGPQQ